MTHVNVHLYHFFLAMLAFDLNRVVWSFLCNPGSLIHQNIVIVRSLILIYVICVLSVIIVIIVVIVVVVFHSVLSAHRFIVVVILHWS